MRGVRKYRSRDEDGGDRGDQWGAPPDRRDAGQVVSDRKRVGGVGRARYRRLLRHCGRRPDGNLATCVETELVADLLDVALGRALGDHQTLSDLAVREAFGHEIRYLALPGAQRDLNAQCTTL